MTLPIDLQFRGVGRIHVRSGTYKRQVRDAMKQMFRTLYQVGRQDVLRDVKAGKVAPMEVYERFRLGKLDQLPTGDLMRPVGQAFQVWLDGKEVASRTLRDYQGARTRLLGFGSPGAALTELPAMLQAYRKDSRGTRPRTFDKDRSAWLSFLATTLGEQHWLHGECRRVEVLKVTDDRKMAQNPQTLEEVRTLAAKFAATDQAHHARTLWTYVLTGMRPEELFEEEANTWENETGWIRVNGTKNTAAKRVVPKVGLHVKPSTRRRAFAKALAKVSGDTVTPYDLRRTFAQLIDLLHFPTFRQDFYMGHGPKNPREQYRRMKECLPYVAEDTAALEHLVAEPAGLRILK